VREQKESTGRTEELIQESKGETGGELVLSSPLLPHGIVSRSQILTREHKCKD
jgi:hypothetical protein